MKKPIGLVCLSLFISLLPTILIAQIEVPTQDEFFEIIRTEGADKGEEIFSQVRKVYPDTLFFSENDMNLLGYEFMFQDRLDEAIVVFRLNIEAYPNAWNVYDSMGEAYMHNNKKEKAIIL